MTKQRIKDLKKVGLMVLFGLGLWGGIELVGYLIFHKL